MFRIILGSLFLVVLLAACHRGSAPPQSLDGTSWVLLKFSLEDGTLLEPAGEQPITLKFQADQATGHTGCNSFFASYSTKSGQLQFNGMGVTEKYCEGLMEQENQYLGLLENALSYTIRPGQLEISCNSGKLLFEQDDNNNEKQGS